MARTSMLEVAVFLLDLTPNLAEYHDFERMLSMVILTFKLLCIIFSK